MNEDTMKEIINDVKDLSRAEATWILMSLQAIVARAGHAHINAALEMAISCIVKKHRNVCRNKAKRRAAKEVA